jgi:uncharacterized protein with PIN domain
VLVRDPRGKFETRAILCTDLHQTSRQIVEWFLSRWQVEVTFQQVRAHLGVETQKAVVRLEHDRPHKAMVCPTVTSECFSTE